ncbi:MAG: FAD-binding oxidoreductase [Alphaproteobacteria bacterium]
MPAHRDVLVVGAGIAGCATAYFLRRRGFHITLLDPNGPGWGASGRNPGFLWLQTKAAGTQMGFALAARLFAERFADEIGDESFRACGGLIVYRDSECKSVADAFAADRNKAGLPVQHLDAHNVHERCPQLGPAIIGGIWNPLDAHQDTPNLCRKIVARLSDLGVDCRFGTGIASLIIKGEQCIGVRTTDGEDLHSDRTVLCAGPWSTALAPELDLGKSLIPMRFEAACTSPADFRIDPVVAGQSLFRFFTAEGVDESMTPRHRLEREHPDLGFTEQFASMPDGSIRYGCAFQDSDSDASTAAGQKLGRGVLEDNLAALRGLATERSWAGIVLRTPDGLPIIDIDCGVTGLALNTGHFFGNLAGPISGMMIADAIAGAETPYPMAPFSHRRFSA